MILEKFQPYDFFQICLVWILLTKSVLFPDVIDPKLLNQKSQSVDDLSIAGEDYQALSAKEESDLELLMSECQVAMSNAEIFTEQLSKQLSVLDGVSKFFLRWY